MRNHNNEANDSNTRTQIQQSCDNTCRNKVHLPDLGVAQTLHVDSGAVPASVVLRLGPVMDGT